MTPPAARAARRRLALDPRLVVGVALVIASVVAVGALVGAADARITVYAAATTLSPGDRVTALDLVERSVALDGAENEYVIAADLPADGFVLTRAVAAGELVPRSAAGSVDGLRATALVLRLAMPISAAVGPGSLVDVWAAASGSPGATVPSAPPAVLVGDATVVRVIDGQGPIADGGVQVEVLIPRSRVARVLQAIADERALALVPAGLPLEAP